MQKFKSISKRAIAFAIVAALAVGGIALAGTVAVKVFSEPQLVATENTHLLPGRYRNAPQYFYSQKQAVKTTDPETGEPTSYQTVYVPAGHGDNLINSYEINDDGSIEILLQEGKIVVNTPTGVVTQTTSFASFGPVDPDTGIQELIPSSALPLDDGQYEVTIPAEYASVGDPILIQFDVANSEGQPANHPSQVYLILNPELVQVAFTYPIPATFSNP
jgi:hypothetical protein